MNNNVGGIIDARVPLMLAGEVYQLLFDAEAFIRYAEETNRDALLDARRIGSFLEGLAKFDRGEGAEPLPLPGGGLFGLTRDLLWAALASQQPDLKRKDVSRLFSIRDLAPVSNALASALRGSVGEQEAQPANPTVAELNHSR